MDIITALRIAIADNPIRQAGNLNTKIKELEYDDLVAIADSHFMKKEVFVDIFKKGVELGRIAKQKIVYLAKYSNTEYFVFIGGEADIMRKIEEKLKEKEQLEEVSI